MSDDDVAYCDRRAREERALAKKALKPESAAVHSEMAERFENLLAQLRRDRAA